ncbi:MAG TPA: AAA family ATPase [Candidatus Eisenbacteria bacterium]|nr:AAA family ATPase [Candidatus Eisenbacteria bacterium]
MRLLRLKVEGFGPLRGEWTFAPDRTNLVVDDNERGKSSLLAAITAALYGLDDDRRSHRVLTPRERWRPWNGGPFRIALDLEVPPRRLTVSRDFERGTVSVFDDQGREVTAEFLEGRDEYPVGRRLLGVDAAEFEKCALIRQGDLDQVVPGDEKERRTSTLRARLESAADTALGDTNASEALRVLEESLRRYNAPELEFTGTIDNAIERLEAKRGLVEVGIGELENALLFAQPQIDALNALADEEERLQARLRELEAERHAGLAQEVRRKLEEHARACAEYERLTAEAGALQAASRLPPNADAELRETVARHEEALRSLATLEARRREEVDRDRRELAGELETLKTYAGYAAEDADRCVALAAELRQSALQDAQLRNEVFVLREQLAAQGYEPERIQFLNARFGSLPEDHQRLLRQQAEVNLTFQTEVAGLEQQRTQATETLRGVDGARNARRVPGWFVLALGLGAALAGGALLLLRGAPTLALPLLGAGALLAVIGAAVLALGGRARDRERETAIGQLAEAQQKVNQLRTRRSQNEVGLAELARVMGYRDGVDLMRHWNEYARMLEDSGPLMRAQEQHGQAEARRRAMLEQGRTLVRAAGEQAVTPELLEKVAYEARRAIAARDRLAGLEKSFGWVEEEKRALQASAMGLHDKAVRILEAAGVAYDPAKPWPEHVAGLARRMTDRFRYTVVVEELIPAAKKRLLPDVEVEQRRRQLEQLGGDPHANVRAAPEIEVDARGTRQKLEEAQRRRADLRVEVEEVWRRHAQQRPELESQRAALERALARARRFKHAVELARETLQRVATDTHRKWADFLNQRVGEILAGFGTRVDQLRFGDDLDFSVQLEGGPLVSRGKAHLQLSVGARDQLYLAVRLAISEFLSRGGEPLPLLLDDAFATSDDTRLQAGMRALIEGIGAGHQVILVTCHRGRHHDLRRQEPELYRDRVHWVDLRSGVAAGT